MFNKKGISPLIATVLIIGFTVALAAVIMIWGQSFSKSIQESTEQSTQTQLVCAQDVQFAISSACYDAGSNDLFITVANNANKDIKNFQIRLFHGGDVAAVPTGEGLPGLAIKKFTLFPAEMDPEVKPANIQKIELIPVVEVEGKDITCPNTIASFTDLSECAVA